MRIHIKILITVIILSHTSCITINNKLPSWVEIKPQNTSKEIYFVYGPATSKELAKQGLYKEISEYFSVNVSSVEKFVKNVNYQNGTTDIEQSKQSIIDVTSREKGLNSIEIREIWSDNTNKRWCILASIDTKSANSIKLQVEQDIENERLAGIVKLSEKYYLDSELLYNQLISYLSEIEDFKINIVLQKNKINSTEDNIQILDLVKNINNNLNTVYESIKKSKDNANKIKIYKSKNELLLNQVKNDLATNLELEFYIKENEVIFNKSEGILSNISEIEDTINTDLFEINNIGKNSELKIYSKLENSKSTLLELVKEIEDNFLILKNYKSENEVGVQKSEDYLRSIKQAINSKTKTFTVKETEVNTILKSLEYIKTDSQNRVDICRKLKANIISNYDNVLNSEVLEYTQNNNLKEIINNLDSIMSWVEIYNNKIIVLNNNANKAIEEFILDSNKKD